MRAIGFSVLMLALLLAAGCAERRSPTETQVHPPGWNDPHSADFHGTRVRAEGPNICRTCHGQDLHGEPGVASCFDCHNGPGGHPDGWERPSSPNFHGLTVAAKGPKPCSDCHGADYTGGWADVACFSCHGTPPGGHPPGQCGHPVGWVDPSSGSFHGTVVLTQGIEDCTRCHGVGLSGGTSGRSCSECHSFPKDKI